MLRAERICNFQSYAKPRTPLFGGYDTGVPVLLANSAASGGAGKGERPTGFSHSEEPGEVPQCMPLSTDGLGQSIREAVMVTKSSKLSRTLPCIAVSFSRKASVSTCSWVHTWMKRSSCMAGLAERGQ